MISEMAKLSNKMEKKLNGVGTSQTTRGDTSNKPISRTATTTEKTATTTETAAPMHGKMMHGKAMKMEKK